LPSDAGDDQADNDKDGGSDFLFLLQNASGLCPGDEWRGIKLFRSRSVSAAEEYLGALPRDSLFSRSQLIFSFLVFYRSAHRPESFLQHIRNPLFLLWRHTFWESGGFAGLNIE